MSFDQTSRYRIMHFPVLVYIKALYFGNKRFLLVNILGWWWGLCLNKFTINTRVLGRKKIDETCNGFLEIIKTVFDKHVFLDTGVIVRNTCS